MSVSVASEGTIVLEGACPDDDAEQLLQLLLAAPAARIDWRRCTTAHSAVIQLLLAAGLPLLGPPADASLARWIQPLFSPTALLDLPATISDHPPGALHDPENTHR